MNPATLRLIAALIALLLAFAAGWRVESWRKSNEITELKAEYLRQQGAAADGALKRLIAARARGDALEQRLAAEESTRETFNQEKTLEIRHLTVGRPCLAGAVVRLLNLPDGIKPGAVSEAARQSLPADAGFASDTDVAEWSALCHRSYDTCRGRLKAIDDFYRFQGDASPRDEGSANE